ncbi:hypothetical protein CATMIT_00557 [Catenibacterium mitsuokai DSM 15897]|nr:hypothetical protein CATMIT_00557 [Catenibacterium mitsuokai DSM 15897]
MIRPIAILLPEIFHPSVFLQRISFATIIRSFTRKHYKQRLL